MTRPDAAWRYRHPTPLARKVKKRVAFWVDVEIVHDDDTDSTNGNEVSR